MTSTRRVPPLLPVLVLSLALLLLLSTTTLAFVALPLRSSCSNVGLRRPHAAAAAAAAVGPRAAAAAAGGPLLCAHHEHDHHHHEEVAEAQAPKSDRIRKRDVLFARLPAPWARFRQQRKVVAALQDKKEEDEEGREGEGKMVELFKASGAVLLAAIGPNPWDRGMGINPTPPNALAMWGPYVGTLLFLTFGMRGLEPLKRFLYDRQKRRKQAKKAAQKPKKKNQYYRAPSRLYDMAKAKLEQKQEGEMSAAQAGTEGAADGSSTSGEEGGEDEEEEEVEEQLSAYRCEVCSFTIYPARGREFKFFPAGFKCPSCGSTKEKFYDLTDSEDPRNQEDSGAGSSEADENLGDDDAFKLDDEELGAEGDEPLPPAVLAVEPGGVE